VADSRGVGDAARLRHDLDTLRVALPACEVVPGNGRRDVNLADHEWLVTNGIGGYASGTVSGETTRRYHGMLVAALPNPLGRTVMLNALADGLPLDRISAFRVEGGVPVWRYALPEGALEKRVFMPHRQNTVVVQYALASDARDAVALRLTPAVDFRNYEEPVAEREREEYTFDRQRDDFIIAALDYPPLRLLLEGEHEFVAGHARRPHDGFAVEVARGYRFERRLWSPGTFVLWARPGQPVAFVASTDDPDVARAMLAGEALDAERERCRRLLQAVHPAARDDVGALLALAADQFIIKPVGRVRDTVRATALGEELRTVIAGYHWFTDWGRDTMISLEGLTLVTGRHREAGFILRTFAHYVRDGLIPNMFPDGSDEGLYHTADATLWFFHALERYSRATGYWSLVAETLPVLRGIVEAHLSGTRFGIGMDPSDGLLRQGAEGYQLTWMDAKVDGWVVTPRRGKPVEINALWYNALMLLSGWERQFGDAGLGRRFGEAAARARESFNRRFWYAEGGHLYDVIDGPGGDDPACRPNQVLAISLDHSVLDESRWAPVLEVVRSRLLTPVGLRSLAPGHPDYKSRYFGDLRARDAAYHQGTVWGWLIGPWIDAWLKVHPDDRAGARRFLDGLVAHLPDFGVGSIAEIFDAEPPFTPRGCVAQAWSVAEALRCWVRTAT